MNSIGTTILTTALSVFTTLLVTFIFNYITNRPKERKKKEQEYRDKLKKEILDIVQGIHDEVNKQSDQYKNDYECLTKAVEEVQLNIKAGNKGLQEVLKDLLKTKYLEWINKGYTTINAKDELERMYQAYHRLGANGVMDCLREEFMELPVKTTDNK